MSQPAMSAIWDGKWNPLSDFELDKWLLFKDKLCNKKVNDFSLKPTRCEIAEQVLHDIEDLGKNNVDYWLDELPLFDEIQPSKISEVYETKCEQEIETLDLIFDQEQLLLNDDSALPDFHKELSYSKDLFSASYENTATFVLSNENIHYFNKEPVVSFTSLQRGCENFLECSEEKEPFKDSGEKENVNFHQTSPLWDAGDVENVKNEMAVVDEILKNTALEIDQWESDTSRSEVSSDCISSSFASPKEREVQVDDPDWKPDSLAFEGRKQIKKSKPYWRGGSQEEKKLRKKEQNKNAATRYRQKKKAEVCEILKEEVSLKEKKAKLEKKVADIQTEIKYLKALMRDLFRAKKIIN